MFKDPAVRYGIKWGLSSVLAFYIALTLNLKNPTWAVFTVFVLMFVRYVGAIIEKSLLRIVGTLAGGVLAVWLVGNHVQNAFFFLPVFFLLLAICTYKFGSPKFPYAWFVAGMTLGVVVGGSISQPEQVFEVAKERVLEICTGILSSMVVVMLVWPLHAAEEFRRIFRECLTDLRDLTMELFRAQLNARDPKTVINEVEERTVGTITQMRNLLHFAKFESKPFREREEDYAAIVHDVILLRSCVVGLYEPIGKEGKMRDELRGVFEGVVEALEKDFSAFIERKPNDPVLDLRIPEAVTLLEARLEEIRREGSLARGHSDEVLRLGQLYLAVREIARHLESLREGLVRLHTPLKRERKSAKKEAAQPFKLDPFWLRNAIRGGLVYVLSLLFIEWTNAPGAATISLGAWVLTILTRSYPSGRGDLRAFHLTLLFGPVGVAVAVFCLLASAALSSYFVMNLFLFVSMFLFGWLSYKNTGVTYAMQVTVFLIAGVVALNAQEPVSFQQIASVSLGVFLALFVAAVVSRTLWPVLPQNELRKTMQEFFEGLRTLLPAAFSGEKEAWEHMAPVRRRLALIPNELRTWIKGMNMPAELPELRRYLLDLEPLLQRLHFEVQAVQRTGTQPVPEGARMDLEVVRSRLDAAFAEAAEALKEARDPEGMPEVQSLSDEVSRHVAEVRQSGVLKTLPTGDVARFFGLVGRSEALLKDAGEVLTRLRRTKVPYWACDYAL